MKGLGKISGLAGALALAGLSQAQAIEDERTRTVTLPVVSVTQADVASIGITGASSTVITAEDIGRAPQESLVDIISREGGVQSTNLQGGVNNAGNTGTIDLRGFGAAAPSNTLVLVDGRRFNDSDLTGFDFSLIPRNSIERIEIVRGNSGAVLYGDGAIGGVINIVTKNGIGQKPNVRVEGGLGSLGTRESKISASGSWNGFSSAAFGNFFDTNGYRTNSATRQQQGVGDFRYTAPEGSVFLNMGASHVDQRLPGPRNASTTGLLPFFGPFNEYATDRRGTNTPFDNAQWDNFWVRGGVTRNFGAGIEGILDGSYRQKNVTFQTFTPSNYPFGAQNAPLSFNTFDLKTYAVTPRVNVDQMWGTVRARLIAGVDIYKTDYESFRRLTPGVAPNHIYNLNQTTSAAYAQPTFTFWNNTDISVGGRVQRNELTARDLYDPTAPFNGGVNGQGSPLNTSETRHAWHVGFEHRFTPMFGVFGRAAQAFRVPNVDERVGQAPAGGTTNFNLRTQRSHDIEGGAKANLGPVTLMSSIYQMHLVDELRFNPVTGVNTNFAPTSRIGWENTLNWRVMENVRIKATVTHIDAQFRSSVFSGKDVPLVSEWSGNTTLSWDILGPRLTADLTARYFSSRWADQDEANVGRIKVPSYALVDLRVGGVYDRYFWSATVQNLFDKKYYDFAQDTSFPPSDFFSIYPLPGRTFMARLGANLP